MLAAYFCSQLLTLREFGIRNNAYTTKKPSKTDCHSERSEESLNFS